MYIHNAINKHTFKYYNIHKKKLFDINHEYKNSYVSTPLKCEFWKIISCSAPLNAV